MNAKIAHYDGSTAEAMKRSLEMKKPTTDALKAAAKETGCNVLESVLMIALMTAKLLENAGHFEAGLVILAGLKMKFNFHIDDGLNGGVRSAVVEKEGTLTVFSEKLTAALSPDGVSDDIEIKASQYGLAFNVLANLLIGAIAAIYGKDGQAIIVEIIKDVEQMMVETAMDFYPNSGSVN